MDTEAITPDTPIERVIAIRPAARGELRAIGVDLCCGGALSLREASELKGVPLPDILRAARGAPDPSRIEAHETIRGVIARAPHLAAVFEKHGLAGCGGPGGPDERLDLFARLHRVDLDALLRDLNGAPGAPPPAARTACAAPIESPPQATLYRRFVIAALVCTMTLGATFGAYQLMALHMAIGSSSPAHARSHASFQVMGFVLLFIMGVSYHALPRFLGVELALDRWARRTFWLATGGLLLKSYGLLAPLVPFTVAALAAGTALQAAAVAVWCAVLGVTWRRSRVQPELFHAYVGAGTFFWLVAAGFLVAGALRAIAHGEVEPAARWNESHYLAALLGGSVLWVEGMFLRTAAQFLGLRPARRSLLVGALGTGIVGALVSLVGPAIESTDVRAVGVAIAGLGLVLFALGARVFERRAPDADPDRHLALLLRLAMAAGVLFAVLGGVYAVPSIFGVTMRSLVYDGARHALTLGFVTVTIFAMAGRILPVFAGAALRWRPLWAGGSYLILAGVLQRETEIIPALGGPDWFLNVSGTSGFVAATGVCAASISILATLASGARRTRRVSPGPAAPITADSTVAEVLASGDRALEVLVALGFEPLANPVLRATFARGVTLRQACSMKGVPVEEALAKLRAANPAPRGPRRLPVSA